MASPADEMTLAQAAELAGVSKSRVEQWIRDGRLHVRRTIGTLRVVLRSEVLAIERKPEGYPKGRPRKDKPQADKPKVPAKKKGKSWEK